MYPYNLFRLFPSSQMLKYISSDEGGSSLQQQLRSRGPHGLIVSSVVFGETSVAHSGTYKCEPGAAPPARVLVHVIDGEEQARNSKCELPDVTTYFVS